MIRFERLALGRVVALAVSLPFAIFSAARADDPVALPNPDETPPAAQAKPDEARPADESAVQQKPKESAVKDSTNGGGSGQRFDAAVVSAGQAAFERSCTQCHDAARALDRTK